MYNTTKDAGESLPLFILHPNGVDGRVAFLVDFLDAGKLLF